MTFPVHVTHLSLVLKGSRQKLDQDFHLINYAVIPFQTIAPNLLLYLLRFSLIGPGFNGRS